MRWLAADTFSGLGVHATRGQHAGAGLVIRRVPLRGPNGAADEFVGYTIPPLIPSPWSGRAPSRVECHRRGADSCDASRCGVVVAPDCFYLVTNSSSTGGPYSGSVAGDATFATGITDDGGIAITRPELSVVNAVGMSTGSAYVEGTSLTPLLGTGNNLDQGYERKPGSSASHATNTGNNASDFALITPSNPQSSASTCIGETPVDDAPSVSATTPANGATGVPGTTYISVTFSEPVAVAGDWF